MILPCTIDEAVVAIQDSTATITATTERLTGLESGNKKVLEVVENLLTKVSDLESKISTNVTPSNQNKVTPPLYIRGELFLISKLYNCGCIPRYFVYKLQI